MDIPTYGNTWMYFWMSTGGAGTMFQSPAAGGSVRFDHRAGAIVCR